MDVQQIEVIQLRNLRHARGQRQVVGRVIEKRITRDLDLVVVDIWFRSTEPDGLGVGNEMNVMPTLGQLEAQLGGDNAATTVGGIACDSNLHSEKGRPFLESVPKSLSFDGKDKLWMQILYEIGLWSE